MKQNLSKLKFYLLFLLLSIILINNQSALAVGGSGYPLSGGCVYNGGASANTCFGGTWRYYDFKTLPFCTTNGDQWWSDICKDKYSNANEAHDIVYTGGTSNNPAGQIKGCKKYGGFFRFALESHYKNAIGNSSGPYSGQVGLAGINSAYASSMSPSCYFSNNGDCIKDAGPAIFSDRAFGGNLLEYQGSADRIHLDGHEKIVSWNMVKNIFYDMKEVEARTERTDITSGMCWGPNDIKCDQQSQHKNLAWFCFYHDKIKPISEVFLQRNGDYEETETDFLDNYNSNNGATGDSSTTTSDVEYQGGFIDPNDDLYLTFKHSLYNDGDRPNEHAINYIVNHSITKILKNREIKTYDSEVYEPKLTIDTNVIPSKRIKGTIEQYKLIEGAFEEIHNGFNVAGEIYGGNKADNSRLKLQKLFEGINDDELQEDSNGNRFLEVRACSSIKYQLSDEKGVFNPSINDWRNQNEPGGGAGGPGDNRSWKCVRFKVTKPNFRANASIDITTNGTTIKHNGKNPLQQELIISKYDTAKQTIKFDYTIEKYAEEVIGSSLNHTVCYQVFGQDDPSSSYSPSSMFGNKCLINRTHFNQVNHSSNVGVSSWSAKRTAMIRQAGAALKYKASETIEFTAQEMIDDSTKFGFINRGGGEYVSCRLIGFGPQAIQWSYQRPKYVNKINSRITNQSNEACIVIKTDGGEEERVWINPPNPYLKTGEAIDSHTGIGLESFAQRNEQWSFRDDNNHRSFRPNRSYTYYDNFSSNHCSHPSSVGSPIRISAYRRWCDRLCQNSDDRTKCELSYNYTSSSDGDSVSCRIPRTCSRVRWYSNNPSDHCSGHFNRTNCLNNHSSCRRRTIYYDCSYTETDSYTKHVQNLRDIKCTYWRREPKAEWHLTYYIIKSGLNNDAVYSKAATDNPVSLGPRAYYTRNSNVSEQGVVATGYNDLGKGKDKNDDFELIKSLINPVNPRNSVIRNMIDNPNKKGFKIIKKLAGNLTPGSKICFGLSVHPWHYESASGGEEPREERTSDNLWMHSAAVCSTITKQPFAEVTSNSLYANEVLVERNNRVGDGWPLAGNSLRNQNSGSFAEYAIIAKNQVDNMFRSNGYTLDSIVNDNEVLHTLTLSNGDINNLGNISFNADNPRVIGFGLKDIYDRKPDVFKNAEFITSRNYEIKNNFQNNSASSVDDYKPKVIVMTEPNSVLTIAPNVERLDAWIIVNGKIRTCPIGAGANDCNHQLIINGPVVANKIELRRTYGGGMDRYDGTYNYNNDQIDRPAEVFNM